MHLVERVFFYRLVTRINCMDRITEAKERQLSTSVTAWKITVSTVALFVLCSGSVAAFGYIYLTMPKLQCHTTYFYLSLLWLGAEYAVIGYLYCYKNIPKFAREAMVFSILLANIWFILFIFGLKECTV